MKIIFEITMEDWLAFQKYHFNNSKTVKRNNTLMMLSIPLIVSVFFFMDWLSNGKPDYVLLAIFGILSIVILAFTPARLKNVYMKQAKKLFEEGNNSAFLGAHEIMLNDSEITAKEPGTTSTVKWDTIIKYHEDDKYMFLFITPISALIIPKEKAETDADKEQVFEFIRDKVNSLNSDN